MLPKIIRFFTALFTAGSEDLPGLVHVGSEIHFLLLFVLQMILHDMCSGLCHPRDEGGLMKQHNPTLLRGPQLTKCSMYVVQNEFIYIFDKSYKYNT